MKSSKLKSGSGEAAKVSKNSSPIRTQLFLKRHKKSKAYSPRSFSAEANHLKTFSITLEVLVVFFKLFMWKLVIPDIIILPYSWRLYIYTHIFSYTHIY